MTVRLDNRHPPLPKTGWENEDLILILRKKMEFFADSRYKCFQCQVVGVKEEKNTKTNKLELLKIENLQHKTCFLTCIYIFPLVT
jgi:hypothetical protein